MIPSITFRKIDVDRLLEAGGEPFPEIRRRLAGLEPDEGLEIIASFIPSPLIELLGSEGFEHQIDHDPNGEWITRFWRPQLPPSGERRRVPL